MRKFVFLAFSTFGLFANVYAQSNFSGGNGTESDPYLIKNISDLQQLTSYVSGGGKYSGIYFELAGNIDLSGQEIPSIGEYFNSFDGFFDGKGFQISNFKITGESGDYGVGLFGATGENAVIKNLTLSGDNSVSGENDINYTGALCGYNKGVIDNCTVTCDVTGYRYVGGVTGNNTGTVRNCTFLGTVGGQWFVGGISGYLDYPGSMELCANKGTVNGVKHVGGIVGQANGNSLGRVSVSLCYNAGVVTMTGGADGSYETMAGAGGIAGYIYLADIRQCFNKSLVQSDNFNPYVGGIVGNNMDALVEDCYNTWTVTGTNGAMVGGIAGINKGENSIIRDCYNTAKVYADAYSDEICPAEENLGTVDNCYFDKQTASVNGTGGISAFTNELVSASGVDGFDSEKWVFADNLYPRLKGLEELPEAKLMASAVICRVDEVNNVYDKLDFITSDFRLGVADGVTWTSGNAAVAINGSDAVVERSVDGDIDVLLTAELDGLRKIIPVVVVADLKGSGTEEDPFLIENPNQLRYISSSVASGITYKGQYIRLANDLDLGGEDYPFAPIGTNDGYYFFEGNFDGNGKTVSNLYINLPDEMYVGLFGRLAETAVVRNVTVGSGYVNGMGNVGAVVGQSAGQVYGCGNYAEVTGTSGVGGVVGAVSYGATGELSDCFNLGDVSSARGTVGGIVGTAGYVEKITHCFNSGKVTDLATGRTPGQVGGIVASTSVSVEYCYNTGIISDLSDDESRSIAGGIAGRASGSADAPVRIYNCFNTGKVLTATGLNCSPIVGVFGTDNDNAASCYYDSKVMEGDYADAIPVPTIGFTDASTVGELTSAEWSFFDDSYPVLKCFDGLDAAKFASMALFLSGADTYSSVTEDFTVTAASDGMRWMFTPYYAFEAQGTNVTVKRQTEDMECRIGVLWGNVVKEFNVTLKSSPSSVDGIPTGEEISVTASGGNLTVRNVAGEDVYVYDVYGRCVYSSVTSGDVEVIDIDLDGMFIVKVGERTAKVVL